MGQFQGKVSAISGEWDVFAAKHDELALEAQSLAALTEEARSLRASVSELRKANKTKVVKV